MLAHLFCLFLALSQWGNICLIAKLVQFGIIHADSPTSRRTAQLSSTQLSLARLSQGLIEATTIHKDSHVD